MDGSCNQGYWNSKNQKEMLEIKNTVPEMKNDFDWLTSRLVTGRQPRKESVSLKTCQQNVPKLNGVQRGKWKSVSKNSGAVTQGVAHT